MAIILTMVVINQTTSNKRLFSKIVLKQGNQSDYAFAKRLGITRPLWQLTRTGRLQIGITLLKAIARTYPDIHQDIINFLKDSAGEEAKVG